MIRRLTTLPLGKAVWEVKLESEYGFIRENHSKSGDKLYYPYVFRPQAIRIGYVPRLYTVWSGI